MVTIGVVLLGGMSRMFQIMTGLSRFLLDILWVRGKAGHGLVGLGAAWLGMARHGNETMKTALMRSSLCNDLFICLDITSAQHRVLVR